MLPRSSWPVPWLGLASGSRITRGEFFEIDDLDAALVRFEELRAARIST